MTRRVPSGIGQASALVDHVSPEPAPPAAAPDHNRARRRRELGSLVLVAGAALVVLGAFLPWVISGSATRSSFATVRSADRLGVVPDGVALALLRSWYLVPLAAAIIPVAVVLGRRRLALITAVALAGVAAVVAGLVIHASPSTGAGPAVSLAGSATLLAGTAILTRTRTTTDR